MNWQWLISNQDRSTLLPVLVLIAISQTLIFWRIAYVNRKMIAASHDAVKMLQEQLLAERKAAALAMVAAQEEERSRIASGLHDDISQLLIALSFEIQSFERKATNRHPVSVAHASQLVEQLWKKMHDSIWLVAPGNLDERGLRGAVEDLVFNWSKMTGIKVETYVEDLASAVIPREVEQVVYRTIQEALSNVARHAAAEKVSVVALIQSGALRLSIEDNGKGFHEPGDSDAPSMHMGLSGMRQRLATVGGNLTIESVVGDGATIYAQVPIPG